MDALRRLVAILPNRRSSSRPASDSDEIELLRLDPLLPASFVSPGARAKSAVVVLLHGDKDKHEPLPLAASAAIENRGLHWLRRSIHATFHSAAHHPHPTIA